MAWELIETPDPMMRWQTRLTFADPDAGPQSLALIDGATVQAEGVFGTGAVQFSGSNSGGDYVPFDALRHGDIVPVLPVLWLQASLLDGDETSDVLVTVAGRR